MGVLRAILDPFFALSVLQPTSSAETAQRIARILEDAVSQPSLFENNFIEGMLWGAGPDFDGGPWNSLLPCCVGKELRCTELLAELKKCDEEGCVLGKQDIWGSDFKWADLPLFGAPLCITGSS